MGENNMVSVKVFCDGNYWGYYSLREVINLEKDAKTKAYNAQKKNPADHMVYSTKEYNEDGDICTVHLYSGYPMDDKTFEERTSSMKNYRIGAFHKMSNINNKAYFIKTTYNATATNPNFKGHTQVYYKGRSISPKEEKDFLPYLSYHLGNGHGYTTKAAVSRALKAYNDLAEFEMAQGFWVVNNEIVEFDV